MRPGAALPRPPGGARGQVAVEFAITIVFVLGLLVGFFDLARGLAVQAAVSEMAWAGARFAASGACLSNPRDEQPSTTTGEVSGGAGQPCPGGSTGGNLSMNSGSGTTISATQQDVITARARAAAFGIDPSTATITIQLPDGGARLGQRVRVIVTYPYVPISSQFTGGRGTILLSSSQTLLIGR